MMFFLLVACVILPANGPVIKKEPNDLSSGNLKGRVRSIMEIRYTAVKSADTVYKDSIVSHYYTIFNIDGYKTEITKFEGSEGFTLTKYIFNDQGTPIGLNQYDRFGNLVLTVSFAYDRKGKRTEAAFNWPGEDKEVRYESAEEFGFNIEEDHLIHRVLYIHRHGDLRSEEVYLDDDSTVLYRNVFKYDFRGVKEESGYFNSRGNLSWRTDYKWDADGKLLEANLYKDNRIALESKYHYETDTLGNWVKCIEDRNLHYNVLTAHLDSNDYVVERKIEYFPQKEKPGSKEK